MGIINETCSLLRPLSTSIIGGVISGMSLYCKHTCVSGSRLLIRFSSFTSFIAKVTEIKFQKVVTIISLCGAKKKKNKNIKKWSLCKVYKAISYKISRQKIKP